MRHQKQPTSLYEDVVHVDLTPLARRVGWEKASTDHNLHRPMNNPSMQQQEQPTDMDGGLVGT